MGIDDVGQVISMLREGVEHLACDHDVDIWVRVEGLWRSIFQVPVAVHPMVLRLIEEYIEMGKHAGGIEFDLDVPSSGP